MKRLLGGVAVVAVLLLFGVAGVSWLGRLATTSDTDTAGSSSNGGSADTNGGGAAGPAADDPPPPPRSVSVAGVRLDGTAPDQSCAVVTNPNGSVPITIVTVTFRHDEDQLAQESTHCRDHQINGGPVPGRVCTAGVTLPPSAVYAEGCNVGAKPRVPGGPYNLHPAQVELTLAVTCTSRDAAPCDQIDPQYEPSRDAPIEARWTETVEVSLNPGDYPEPEVTP